MRRLEIPLPDNEALQSLDRLYRTTRDVRLRTRALIVLLAIEKQMVAAEIASIVRTDEQTVRRWLKRYAAEGIAGLDDAARPGGPRKVTDEYLAKLVQTVRLPPSSAGLSHRAWTAHLLATYLAEQTGITVDPETVRLHLKAAGITLSASSETISTARKVKGPANQPESLK